MSDVEIVLTHEPISGDCEEAEREIKGLRKQLAAANARIAELEAQADNRAYALLMQAFDGASADLAAQTARAERAEAALKAADSLLDCTEFALEWFFEKFDDPKHFQCDCSEDGGYMDWDTNAYIHTERCSSGRDDSLDALKDQIGQWRQHARAVLAGERGEAEA